MEAPRLTSVEMRLRMRDGNLEGRRGVSCVPLFDANGDGGGGGFRHY